MIEVYYSGANGISSLILALAEAIHRREVFENETWDKSSFQIVPYE